MSKNSEIFHTNNFSVVVDETEREFCLRQTVLNSAIHTEQLPGTQVFLAENLASIFQNKCFNDHKQSFKDEVGSTEIGHLLEHLILEFMKIAAEKEFDKVTFSGETIWDWKKDPRGTYLINIRARKVWRKFFPPALSQAITVLDQLYDIHSDPNSKWDGSPTLS